MTFVSVWLHMRISSCICVAAEGIISFFFTAQWYSIVYVYHIFFILSSLDGHLGRFHVLATVNSAAVNTGVHVSFRIRVFVLSRCVCRSGIPGSYGNSLFRFFFFYLFMAAPMAYGGPTGAVAACLCQSHSNPDLSHVYDLHHSSQQRRILKPLSEARNGSLMDASWVR